MKKKVILALTSAGDPNIPRVSEHLNILGRRLFRFNTEEFPSKTSIALMMRDGVADAELINSDGETLAIRNVLSCWYRQPGIPGRDSAESYREFVTAESRAALWSLTTLFRKQFRWINDPLWANRLLEDNKLHQLALAKMAGLRTPATLITNKPDEALQFCENRGGRVALKLLCGNFFSVAGNPDTVVYTQLVPASRIKESAHRIAGCPIQIQEYIPKKLELRITVVGVEIFVCKIYSQDSPRTTVDWRRYDFEKVRHEPAKLPSSLNASILRFMSLANLRFGAIDMIQTPDDEYVFLEVNPSGQWAWIEDLTGLPISKSLAKLLAKKSHTLTAV